jgi:polyhydroxyalkanoate synthesis repressor PhaR
VVTQKKMKASPARAKSTPDTPISQENVIKKYPNRRLYDTASSSYITLAQVRQLVIDGKPLRVCDAKSGEDLTRSILLQIILEEEMAGVPMFSQEALTQMIRFYGHTMQGLFGQILEKNMQTLTEMQTKLGAGSLPAMATPAQASQLMGYFLDQSQSMTAQMQEHFLAAVGLKR